VKKKLITIFGALVAGVGVFFAVFYLASKPNIITDQITGSTTEPVKKCNLITEKISYSEYRTTNVLWQENNKFGLYVYAEEANMFELAQKLVNSNGGKWGYVLIPYNVKDRDTEKWNRVFTQLTEKKLIPIIQLWDVDTSKYKKQTKEAVQFLNNFDWPIKYRYVSVYNEPNDSKFWYGTVDPAEYAKILDYTIKTFKAVNENYFMINGALNISAADNTDSMDAFTFMSEMNKAVEGIFNKLDGWASHPYPQPNFSGQPTVVGRFGIRGYDTELRYLKANLGLAKELPVFITETGWAHAEGKNYNPTYLPVKTVAKYIAIAYQDYWLKDDRVRAVTPFTIKYQAPFDHFSWVNEDNVPYLHYEAIRSIPKIAGEPPILEYKEVVNTTCQ
jgi:hypothetical protein